VASLSVGKRDVPPFSRGISVLRAAGFNFLDVRFDWPQRHTEFEHCINVQTHIFEALILSF
jgi:hypothetical protein